MMFYYTKLANTLLYLKKINIEKITYIVGFFFNLLVKQFMCNETLVKRQESRRDKVLTKSTGERDAQGGVR